MSSTAVPVLDVQQLTVEFRTRHGTVRAVEKVNLTVAKGEIVGVVGESGSGKSVTSFAVMRILDRAGKVAAGSIHFTGLDIGKSRESEMRDLRGRAMSMIFQNPRAALNPIRTVGRQIEDVLIEHAEVSRMNAREKAIEMLNLVRIARPEERYDAYPFELSGGMCQRIVIALALACRPQLLIADEPTTGLDVTTQKAVMDLVTELVRERGMSMILITHDLGLASAYCNKIVVMQKGQVVETAPASVIFKAPEHPYTRKLMRATPRPGVTLRDLLPEDVAAGPVGSVELGAQMRPLLEVRNLVKEYPRKGGVGGLFKRAVAELPFRAVSEVSFTVHHGESLALVGESGCGKSTTSMMITRLIDPTTGQILFDGEDLAKIPAKVFAKSPLRPQLQMVFQDPTESLNPRYTAARSIADPLINLGAAMPADALRAKVEECATLVGLPHDLLDRFPHQLSGGQKARVGIARAIALRPRLVILDEPTAALDVSVQAVVLNLLADLKSEIGMSYLFVSHDLEVVRMLCDRVVVMRAGEIVETGSTAKVLHEPTSEYTRELLASIPKPPV